MRIIRRIVSIIGVVLALMGLVWMAQGSGIFPYPARSFMINQTPWILRGAIACLVGLILFLGAQRFIRQP